MICTSFHLKLSDSDGILAFEQTYHEAIKAAKISLKKVPPFTLPYTTTNIGSAVLGMDLVY